MPARDALAAMLPSLRRAASLPDDEDDAALTMLLRLQPAVERRTPAAGASGKPLKGCIIRGCPVRADSRLYCARYRLCEEHQRNLEVDASKTPGVRLLMRFCHKCSKMEPLSAFDGSKHTCRRMLSEHNRRRRERYAMDRTAHAAEQRQYRDRAKARRAAEALAQVRTGGEAAEAAAAPAAVAPAQHVSTRPQRNKPRAVWGSAPSSPARGGSEDDYMEEDKVPYAPRGSRSALGTAAAQQWQQQPYAWPAPPAAAPGGTQLQRLWADLVSQSVGGAAAQQHAAQQQAAYNAAAAAAFAAERDAAMMRQRHATALPFDPAAFAAALQATAASQPSLAGAAAAVALMPPHATLPEALAALLDRLQPPPPAPPPPPPGVPLALWQQLSSHPALAAALQQVITSGPPLVPLPMPEPEAAPAPVQHAQAAASTPSRFPSGASAHAGGGAAGGGDDGRDAAQPVGSELLASLVQCREHSSARSGGGSRLEAALAQAAANAAANGRATAAALTQPPRGAVASPGSPQREEEDAERRHLDGASVCTASMAELTHSAVASGGEGAAAEELRVRLRRALVEARAASTTSTSSSGVLARMIQQRGAAAAE